MDQVPSELSRREARREIFTTPELVTAQQSIPGQSLVIYKYAYRYKYTYKYKYKYKYGFMCVCTGVQSKSGIRARAG